MSHYAVAVFMPDDKQSVDGLLAPYDENIEVAPYKRDGELSTYNPDSKWDWYEIGGRWQGMLILKKHANGFRGSPIFKEISKDYDGAFVRDIDFEAMRKREAIFSTYAVVTPDGKWHEPGKMGWWGMPFATPKSERKWHRGYYDRFIKPAIENNWYMVIVDCHI